MKQSRRKPPQVTGEKASVPWHPSADGLGRQWSRCMMVVMAWVIATMLFPPWTLAQAVNVPKTSRLARAAQYYIGDEGELLIKVNIWGRVRQPGQYFVPSNTDLITLISVAGGPAEKSRLDNVRIVRNTQTGSEIIIVNIRKFLKTGDQRLIPMMEPEDTIIMSGSIWYVLSNVVSVVAQLAIVANVYYFFFIRQT
jgi:polysaccharide export outer membrane protein